jgi:hypothetical protein
MWFSAPRAILAIAILATVHATTARLTERTALVPALPHVQLTKRQGSHCPTGTQRCGGICCSEAGECCGSTCYNQSLPYRKHLLILLFCQVVAAMRGKCLSVLSVIVHHQKYADKLDQNVLQNTWVLLPIRRGLFGQRLISWLRIAKCRAMQLPRSLQLSRDGPLIYFSHHQYCLVHRRRRF